MICLCRMLGFEWDLRAHLYLWAIDPSLWGVCRTVSVDLDLGVLCLADCVFCEKFCSVRINLNMKWDSLVWGCLCQLRMCLYKLERDKKIVGHKYNKAVRNMGLYFPET